MDKELILAVAGSGKTRLLIKKLNLEERFLIVTYTENNFKNIQNRIIDKFGHIPNNIRLDTYFSFLYSFCFKPVLGGLMEVNGIYWEAPPGWTLKLKRDKKGYYLDANNRLYHNRIALLLSRVLVIKQVQQRLSKYFDHLFVDEIQDFGGHDYNFICLLLEADLNILTVGDFFQHTFDTSLDGNTNSNLYGSFSNYVKKAEKSGFSVDTTTLEKSYRCSPAVCSFIQNEVGIDIQSFRTDDTEVALIDDEEKAEELFKCKNTIKLFYEVHHKYDCVSENWGKSKGQDCYDDVCVVLNKTTYALFQEGKLADMNPRTKNKFYVACTRAKGNLYFVPDHYYEKHKM